MQGKRTAHLWMWGQARRGNVHFGIGCIQGKGTCVLLDLICEERDYAYLEHMLCFSAGKEETNVYWES